VRYRAGDIVLIWTDPTPFRWWPPLSLGFSIVIPLIRKIGTRNGEVGPIHCAMIVEPHERLEDCIVADSNERGTEIGRIGKWADEVEVARPLNLTDSEVEAMLGTWREWERQGVRYGFLRLAAYFADWLACYVVRWLSLGLWHPRVGVFVRLLPGANWSGRVCSCAVAEVIYRNTRYTFGLDDDDAVRPDDILWFTREHQPPYLTVLPRTRDWWGA